MAVEDGDDIAGERGDRWRSAHGEIAVVGVEFALERVAELGDGDGCAAGCDRCRRRR